LDKKVKRQTALMDYLHRQGYIAVDDIARLFSVTSQTARRDIMDLEGEGKLRRLHGGATLAMTVDAQTYRRRRIENAAGKSRIARIVADMIPDGAALFIDTGTTCEAIAAALMDRKGLRVVTYSLRVASLLSDNTDFTIAIPGGIVRQVDGGVFREETGDFIRRFKFDTAIISVSGIDSTGDLGDDDHAEVAAVTAAMGQAERKLLAADASKFGKRGLVRLASLDDMDAVVTDRPPPPQYMTLFKRGETQLRY
jgi:DeoR family transcriptional regulator, glycerol-3-phosphate regulon repressor